MTEDSSRLLIVDDNKVNRLLLSRSVELLGHRVALAENGRIALERLRSEPFDLLLLDIEMPEVDGFAVLEQLKADPRLREVPVIVTSSVEGLDNIVRCINLGAEDYLPKPVNPVLLKARIGASLEKKHLRDQQKALVRRFVTPEVAEDLLQSGFALGGKRIRATVLFSDIRDFTSLVESQGPEETIDLLNTYFMLMFDAIGSHGGVVNQMIGDGLMALFGAPIPLDDCTGSAVAAGLEMLELIEQFNVERSAVKKAAIRIGIGVATGDVVAGYTGTERRAMYTCIGDTVNLASRLEAHTKVAGYGFLIDDDTQRALGSSVPTQALGGVQFKGKAAAVEIFAVMAGQL
jgi:class 3 adenylate cyclase